jgi:hypothetical protein
VYRHPTTFNDKIRELIMERSFFLKDGKLWTGYMYPITAARYGARGGAVG